MNAISPNWNVAKIQGTTSTLRKSARGVVNNCRWPNAFSEVSSESLFIATMFTKVK
jgi:hypothetical protein